MDSPFDVVRQYFQAESWPFVQAPTEPLLRLNFTGTEASWACLAHVLPEPAVFLFYSLCPFPIPATRYPAVLEFTARANYGLTTGNFEIDLDEGEVRFKTAIDVVGDRLSLALAGRVVTNNVLTMNRYVRGLQDVVDGTLDVAEAILRSESPPPPPPDR